MRTFSVLLLVCVVLAVSWTHGVSAQREFVEVAPTTDMWSARADAALEFVHRTTTFRDGVSGGRSVTLTNYSLLYGGVSDSLPVNDVWASTNGRQWYWVAGTADGSEHPYAESFPARLFLSHTQDSGHRQVIAAGFSFAQGSFGLQNDVWATQNLTRWQVMTDSAPWSKRYFASLASGWDGQEGRLVLAGGVSTLRAFLSDVWSSSDAGRTWTQITGAGSWPPGRQSGVLLGASGGRIMLLTGANATAAFNDVWRTSDDGAWSQLTAAAPFEQRLWARGARLSVANGFLLTGGSIRAGTANDVWVSLNTGTSWGLCVVSAEWGGRVLQSVAMDGQGFLWVMGGGSLPLNSSSSFQGDIWRSVTRYNNATELQTRCNKKPPPPALVDSDAAQPASLLSQTLARIEALISHKASSSVKVQ